MPIKRYKVRIEVEVFAEERIMATGFEPRVRSALVSVMDKGLLLADMDGLRIETQLEIAQ